MQILPSGRLGEEGPKDCSEGPLEVLNSEPLGKWVRAHDVVHIGVLRPSWSSGRKGNVAGMAQMAVSVGSTHLASRHLGWVGFLRCLVGYLDSIEAPSGFWEQSFS